MPKQIGTIHSIAFEFSIHTNIAFCMDTLHRFESKCLTPQQIGKMDYIIWSIPVYRSNSLVSTMGLARYMPREIHLHSALFDPEECEEIRNELIPTFMHEVAHQLAQLITHTKGHDLLWKHTMLLLGQTPQRCYASSIDLRNYRKRNAVRTLGFDISNFTKN